MTNTLSVPLPSEDRQNKLILFLGEHFRPWPEVRDHGLKFPGENATFTVLSPPCTEIPGDREPFKIGMVYGAAFGSERRYAWSLMMFVALRWGQRKAHHNRILPYLRYNGDSGEELPLFEELDPDLLPEEERWQATDRLGIQTMFRRLHHSLVFVEDGDLAAIEAELLRLEKLRVRLDL